MKVTITIDDQDALDPDAIESSAPITASVSIDRGAGPEDLDIDGHDGSAIFGSDHVRLLAQVLAAPAFSRLAFKGAGMDRIRDVARDLRGTERGTENPEYERALVELGSDLMHLGNDRADDLHVSRSAVLGDLA